MYLHKAAIQQHLFIVKSDCFLEFLLTLSQAS